jgi:hypothetical protein
MESAPPARPFALSRKMYEAVEGVHVAVYVGGEVRQEYALLGLPPGYAGYAAARCAPLGQVVPEVAVATFYVFAPGLLQKCLPSAWDIATPEQVLLARQRGLDKGLRRMLGGSVDSHELQEAVSLAREACDALRPAGRVLYAAHAALAEPTEPHLALWHWSTLLREHRGDAHVAALLLAGLDPVEALVLHAAVGGPRAFLQQRRGWSAEEWAAGQRRLEARGLVTAGGEATPEGRTLRAGVERETDAASSEAWQALTAARCRRLADLLVPIVSAIRAADIENGVTSRIALPGSAAAG